MAERYAPHLLVSLQTPVMQDFLAQISTATPRGQVLQQLPFLASTAAHVSKAAVHCHTMTHQNKLPMSQHAHAMPVWCGTCWSAWCCRMCAVCLTRVWLIMLGWCLPLNIWPCVLSIAGQCGGDNLTQQQQQEGVCTTALHRR
jgi:hypothetical protein